MTTNTKRLSILFTLVFVIFCVSYYLITSGYQGLADAKWFTYLRDASDHRFLFFVMIAFLPLIGFPISIICVLCGLKFGLAGGMSVLALAVLWHLVFAYWICKSLIRNYLMRYVAKYREYLEKPPTQETFAYSVAFAALPVIPYTVKNYLIALNNLSFWRYISICWTIQILYGFPIVGLASATQNANYIVLLFALLGLAVVYLLSRWAKQVTVQSAD